VILTPARPCSRTKLLAALLVLAPLGCARPSPPPEGRVLDVPPAVTASSVRAAAPAPVDPPPPPRERTVTLSFRVLDQVFRQDPQTGRESFHTSLELVASTEPPQKLVIGTLHEPSCRLAYDGTELDEGPSVKGGLVCYHAGYGDYVRVTDDGSGRVTIATYGQSEALIGNENPPRQHERTLGRLQVPPGSRLVFELVDADAGVLP
jgi:hypothetical protein